MLFNLLLLSLLIQAVLFIPAYFKQTDKLTDFSYSLTFIVLAIVGLIQSGQSLYHYILAVMIVVWALCLGAYLVVRIRMIKKDKRFDNIRTKFFSFAGFWFLQGITVWLVLIPSLFYFNVVDNFTLLSIVGLLIWLLGLVSEAVADQQKFNFINKEKNKGNWIDVGLWRYSRHPNYFGEICVWLGVYLFTFFSLGWPYILIGLISPVFITIMLLFVSGIPKLEKNADDKWGDNMDYQNYKKSTSILIPWFKKL